MRATSTSSEQAAFSAAYQRCVDRWPIPVKSLTVTTTFGDTHLLVSGPPQGRAVLLLPGGGATATAWAAVAGRLGTERRIIAVDPVGQPGPSVASDRALRTNLDVARWCDELRDHLEETTVDLVGHSYGAWIALTYAIHSPANVRRLALLDPTDCFAPLSLVYRLRAIPHLARPRPAALRRLVAWETAGRPLQPDWLAVVTAAAACGRMHIALPKRPRPEELSRLAMPMLVVLAGHSRAHDVGAVASRARQHLANVEIAELPDATHHTIPAEGAPQLLEVLHRFLVDSVP